MTTRKLRSSRSQPDAIPLKSVSLDNYNALPFVLFPRCPLRPEISPAYEFDDTDSRPRVFSRPVLPFFFSTIATDLEPLSRLSRFDRVFHFERFARVANVPVPEKWDGKRPKRRKLRAVHLWSFRRDRSCAGAVGGTETIIIIIYRTNVLEPTAFYLVKRATL